MQFDGSFGRKRDNQLGFAVLARFDDLPGSAIGVDGEPGRGVAQDKPGVFGAMLAFEISVSRATSAHQPGIDSGHINVVLEKFGAEASGEATEGEFSDRIWQQMWNANLSTDRADIDDPAGAALPHIRKNGKRGIKWRPEKNIQ